MRLSENFELKEFLQSQTASRHNITAQFNPPATVIANLQLLCVNILQPVRNNFGAIRISSGYRSPQLNKMVGGATASQHLTGQAADILGIRATNKALFDFIHNSKLPFDQLIWEYGDKAEPAWVHVSFVANRPPRRQVLYIGNF